MASAITPQTEFAGILRDEETFSVEGDGSFGNQINGWFDRLMLQSGLGVSPSMILGLCLCTGLTLGGLILVIQEDPLTAAMGTFLGCLFPVLFAVFYRSRRQKKISEQLPPMLDELARAAKTGRSLEQCLILVANDTPHPLGSELRNCTSRLSLGLTVEEALRDLPRRTSLIATSVLATALAVHCQSGGDLVRVLERLSQTLRDRQQFQGRLRAATAASRATAVLMIVLPPAILGFFVFRDPNYLSELFGSAWGARVTLTAFLLEFIGGVWVMRILNRSQQV